MEKIQNFAKKFVNSDYRVHLIISLGIRFILIGYGIYHDAVFNVPYTDIDYKVFTDAARHVMNGGSPYDRHTYRYSPLLAIILIPNLYFSVFGKLFFSIIDIFVALLLRKIIFYNIKEFTNYIETNKLSVEINKYVKNEEEPNMHKFPKKKFELIHLNFTANVGMLIWLFNPLTIGIATRGNCDTIAGYFVLLTVFLIQCKKNYVLAGMIHGLSIHFRLYPIFYSLTFYMFLSNYSYYINSNYDEEFSVKEQRSIFKKKYLLYILPNTNQILLVVGCVSSLSFCIGLFHYLYGYKFVYETYLYHFVRNDARHNFSLYFYLQYLTAFIKNVPIWQKILISLPQLTLLIVLSFKYGLNRIAMNFGLLLQTIVMVSYNTVLTSQYFVWILVLLPPCIWQIKISARRALLWISIWFAAQGAWLLPAYFLEFKGQNTFMFIWLQGVAFFCANIAILGRLLMHHKPFDAEVLKRIQ